MHATASLRLGILCAALAALALCGGCTLKKSISTDSSGGSSHSFSGTFGTSSPPQFSPLSQAGTFAVSQSEAETLAKKLHPRQQGLQSWKELAFPLSQSLAHAKRRPRGDRAVSLPGLTLSYGKLVDTLEHMERLLPKLDGNPSLLAKDFTWHRVGPDFLFTGYFEPSLKASRKKSDKYPYPLYKLPPDLRKGKAYYTRNEIDRKGALAGKGLEIAWVHSEMEAFFLHIQGSGRLEFEDGGVSHVLYAGKNNRAYVPIGRVMRDQGLLEPDNVSMRTIRECLLGNPEKCAAIYDSNPSYVFFREAPQGPVGAMGRRLTPYVSIATDRTVLPFGSLVFAMTPLPDASGAPRRGLHALAFPQDTGGAIKNRRVDLFCGPGGEAAHNAGYMDYMGAVYILVKK